LANSFGGNERLGRKSIYQDGKQRWGGKGHDQIHLGFIETKCKEEWAHAFQAQFIKGFWQIQLYKNVRSVRYLQRVNQLMGKDKIVHNLVYLYIYWLFIRYDKRNKVFKMKGNYLVIIL
jgi:hypothetical protein